MHDLVAEEDQVVTLSHLGYIKRVKLDEWRMQRRGGVGKRGMSTRDEDFVTSIFIANTHSILLVFTDKGIVFPLHVYDVPEGSRGSRGRPIINLVPVPDDERVTAVVSVRSFDDEDIDLMFVSKEGLIKRTSLTAFRNLRSGGMRAAAVAEGDTLLLVRLVESYGRNARGNMGINLADGDYIVDALLAPAADEILTGEEDEEDEVSVSDVESLEEEVETAEGETTLLTVTENGYGSRTPFGAYRVQGRNGKGIISFKTGDTTGGVVGAVEVSGDDQLMLVTNTGRVIRISAGSVPVTVSRAVKGVRLMRLEDEEVLVDIERLEEPEEDEETVEAADADAEASETDASETDGPDGEDVAAGTDEATSDDV
jgi:DNA gyrase subunit A